MTDGPTIVHQTLKFYTVHLADAFIVVTAFNPHQAETFALEVIKREISPDEEIRVDEIKLDNNPGPKAMIITE